MMQRVREGDSICWFDSECFDDFEVSMFEADHWRGRAVELAVAEGRGTTWIAHGRDRTFVLRHYHRGGLIGKFNHDRFLRQPVEQSRAIQEFRLLNELRERDLPVPRPCAARMVPGLVWYRADIIVEWIPSSHNLADILERRAIPADSWRHVGTTLADFHRVGLYHSDLNCRNILLDDAGKAWLVDFDKCGLRSPGAWRRRNLQRLFRSLRKERKRSPHFHWSESDWRALLAGYEDG